MKGLKNEFELAMVNEPSMFEPSRFDCSLMYRLISILLLIYSMILFFPRCSVFLQQYVDCNKQKGFLQLLQTETSTVENRCPHTVNFQFSNAVTLKIRSRSPKSNQFFVMPKLYSHGHLGKNPTISSHDIVPTRKCHANADANTDDNGIFTKTNMSPSP